MVSPLVYWLPSKSIVSSKWSGSVICEWTEDWFWSDPQENCHLTVKKLPKTWHFFQKKIAKNCHFFCQWQFCWKNDNFWQFFFEKKVKFLANFWHSNGNFPDGQVSGLVQNWFRLAPNQTFFIWDFLRSLSPKCTEAGLKKSQICPI